MLSMLASVESKLLLLATLTALGCATFFVLILLPRCPLCSWLEWVNGSKEPADPE